MIHHGDLFDVLPTLDAELIDACVTDPPYGIGFMGREWDTFKPGVVAQPERYEAPIESDNPNLSGRHRSPAISVSQIPYDRTLHGQREFQEWTRRWCVEVLRVLKPGAYIVVCGAPRSHHRMMCGLEDAGFVVRDCFAWLFGSGFPKNLNLGDGRGTALKPAHEPIALAWKPFKGTITATYAKYGTGALNIDSCRIATDDVRKPLNPKANDSSGTFKTGERHVEQHDLGRWPANVILDEEAAAQLDAMTGETESTGGLNPVKTGVTLGTFEEKEQRGFFNYGDRGGASRFYYVAKPSREERDFGTEGLTARQRDESRKAGNPGGDNPRNRGLQPRGNFHPTVKPVELMRWLVKLVTPIGGTVLDPFMGSGTTGMACAYEQRQFIGVEREAEYVAIAERRIAAVAPLFSGVA